MSDKIAKQFVSDLILKMRSKVKSKWIHDPSLRKEGSKALKFLEKAILSIYEPLMAGQFHQAGITAEELAPEL